MLVRAPCVEACSIGRHCRQRACLSRRGRHARSAHALRPLLRPDTWPDVARYPAARGGNRGAGAGRRRQRSATALAQARQPPPLHPPSPTPSSTPASRSSPPRSRGAAGGILSTAFILIFGEVIPQSVCSRYGLAAGAKTADIVRLFVFLLYPIAWPPAAARPAARRGAGEIYTRTERKEPSRCRRAARARSQRNAPAAAATAAAAAAAAARRATAAATAAAAATAPGGCLRRRRHP